MKKLLLMSLVALVAITMTSCLGGNPGKAILDALENVEFAAADSTPTQVTEINQATAMQPFDNVSITGDFRVIYEQGTDYNVRVEATEQALKEMTVYVQDSALCICKSVVKPVSKFGDVKIYVSSPNLNEINILGSGLFVADSTLSVNPNLTVSVQGKGRVSLESVTCQGKAIFDVKGSGNIGVNDLKANAVFTHISGKNDPISPGSINMVTLECDLLEADIYGSAEINCDNITAENVNAEIIGSGSVNLKGTIKNVTKNITGSGKINYTEATPTDKNE